MDSLDSRGLEDRIGGEGGSGGGGVCVCGVGGG